MLDVKKQILDNFHLELVHVFLWHQVVVSEVHLEISGKNDLEHVDVSSSVKRTGSVSHNDFVDGQIVVTVCSGD